MKPDQRVRAPKKSANFGVEFRRSWLGRTWRLLMSLMVVLLPVFMILWQNYEVAAGRSKEKLIEMDTYLLEHPSLFYADSLFVYGTSNAFCAIRSFADHMALISETLYRTEILPAKFVRDTIPIILSLVLDSLQQAYSEILEFSMGLSDGSKPIAVALENIYIQLNNRINYLSTAYHLQLREPLNAAFRQDLVSKSWELDLDLAIVSLRGQVQRLSHLNAAKHMYRKIKSENDLASITVLIQTESRYYNHLYRFKALCVLLLILAPVITLKRTRTEFVQFHSD